MRAVAAEDLGRIALGGLLLALTAGCGDGGAAPADASDPDGSAPQTDGRPLEDAAPPVDANDSGAVPDAGTPPGCDGPLEVGRCVDARSGMPCTGFADEEPTFEPLPEGTSLPFVRGPQGSSMFVLAARGRGFEPGDPEQPIGPRSPRLEARLFAPDGELVSLLRERAAFEEDPTSPGRYFDASMFLVVDGPCPAVPLLRARVELRDVEGRRMCGEASFQPDCGG